MTQVASPETSIIRCCPSHPDWPTLATHLVEGFPELAVGDVVRELRRAKQAVEQVDLDPADSLDTAELITRQQLMLLSGRATESARLDPERHRVR
jgi:hypothetical protein